MTLLVSLLNDLGCHWGLSTSQCQMLGMQFKDVPAQLHWEGECLSFLLPFFTGAAGMNSFNNIDL